MNVAPSKLVIEQSYYYDVPPGKVFRALTEPKKLVKWFLKSAKIEPVTGSSFTFKWEGGHTNKGKVLKVSRDRSLVLTWPDVINGKRYPTQASFTLAKKGKGTVLTVKHTGFKDGDDWVWLFGAIQSGWAYFLMNLKSVLEQGVDLRSKHDSP